MSANIATNKEGKEGYVGIEPAWHGQGTVLNNPFTAKEAIEHTGLDFEVLQTPAKYTIGDTEHVVPNRMVNYRSDDNRYLGTVGTGYVPFQNTDAFSFFDNIVKEDSAIYHTAGVIGVGEKVWILAKLPHQLRIGKDDLIDTYILISNGHNGKLALTACVTPVRVVCQNTLSAALHQATNKISIRHTGNAEEKLREAYKLMGITTKYTEEFEKIMNMMAHKELKAKDVDFFLDSVYPLNPENDARTQAVKFREGILESFETGVGQDMKTTKGTLFGLYNGFTYFTDHNKEYVDGNAKIKSIWSGGTATKRQKAFDTLLEMAQ